MRSKFDRNRPKSVDNFYAKPRLMWIIPRNPDKIGILPPISVDNCVDSVDFPGEHTLYMHPRVCSAPANCYRILSAGRGTDMRPRPAGENGAIAGPPFRAEAAATGAQPANAGPSGRATNVDKMFRDSHRRPSV